MAKTSKFPEILEKVYNVTLGLDYEQPTSLESDLDLLADEIMEAELCGEEFSPSSKDGYLTEVLEAIEDPQEKLTKAIKASEEVAAIIGRIDYGNLKGDDPKELEDWIEELISELEGYFNAAK